MSADPAVRTSALYQRPAEAVVVVEMLYQRTFSAGLVAATALAWLAAALASLAGPGEAAATVAVASAATCALFGRHHLFYALRGSWALAIGSGALLAAVHVSYGPANHLLFYVDIAIMTVVGYATSLRAGLSATLLAAAGFVLPHAATGDEASLGLAIPLVVVPMVLWWSTELLARFLIRAGEPETPEAGPRAPKSAPRTRLAPSEHLPNHRPRQGQPATSRGSEAVLRTPSDGSLVSPQRGQVKLTARQMEVLLLCAEGLTHLEVAEYLGLHPQQVRRHLRSARARVKVRTTPQLVAWAMREGLIGQAAQS